MCLFRKRKIKCIRCDKELLFSRHDYKYEEKFVHIRHLLNGEFVTEDAILRSKFIICPNCNNKIYIGKTEILEKEELR